jgi:nicotinate phosphoribosyltransferase
VTEASGAKHALLTDLYELTMADSYHRRDMDWPATFDLFVRELPERRNFLVACGLEQALEYLESLRFDEEAVRYLESLEVFSGSFLERLRDLRFQGDVWAIPEGEVAFAEEPLLRVTAPLVEAQIVETFLLNCITFQTMVASKGARVAIACGDRQFVDFSARRVHGVDAAMKAARASYIAGATATSNLLAGKVYGIKVTGTMAHSYVMAFDDEIEAFRAFASDFPARAVLLIDTFDTVEGARRAVRVASELAGEGFDLLGVRLDSGDVGALSRTVRNILDDAGFTECKIVASGDLDEYRIEELLSLGAPVDLFGVGTQLGTSGDAPSLAGVYKLVAGDSKPRIKLSTGKVTLPGVKQVFRVKKEGMYHHDVIGLEGEEPGGEPLLKPVMRGGRRIADPEPLDVPRARCKQAIACLPNDLRSLHHNAEYKVVRSEQLEALIAEAQGQVTPHT